MEGEPAGVVAVPGKDVLPMAVRRCQFPVSEQLVQSLWLHPVVEDERVDDGGIGNGAVEGRLVEAALVDDGVGQFGHG